jgi:hypothetical protein
MSTGGFIVTLLVILAVVYIAGAYPLFRIAKLTRDCGEDAWFAWVPILNIILMCRIAGVSGWTALLLLLGVIPILGWFVAPIYLLVLWVKIGQRFNQTALGVIAWLVPIVGSWVFAFVVKAEPPTSGTAFGPVSY